MTSHNFSEWSDLVNLLIDIVIPISTMIVTILIQRNTNKRIKKIEIPSSLRIELLRDTKTSFYNLVNYIGRDLWAFERQAELSYKGDKNQLIEFQRIMHEKYSDFVLDFQTLKYVIDKAKVDYFLDNRLVNVTDQISALIELMDAIIGIFLEDTLSMRSIELMIMRCIDFVNHDITKDDREISHDDRSFKTDIRQFRVGKKLAKDINSVNPETKIDHVTISGEEWLVVLRDESILHINEEVKKDILDLFILELDYTKEYTIDEFSEFYAFCINNL